MVDKNVDVLIVGGGLIGALLMIALAPTKLRCLLVDNQSLSHRLEEGFDARSIALSTASVRILQMLQVWPSLIAQVEAIKTIHVSEQRRFGHVLLQQPLDEPLGYVVEMQHLQAALFSFLDQKNLMTQATLAGFDLSTRTATIESKGKTKTIQAALIVAADGADSAMRRFCRLDCQVKAYEHQALVTNIGIARGHRQVAYERFTAAGPLALLPMTHDRASLVWSLLPEDAERLLHASEPVFLNALYQAFGYRLGRFVKVGERAVYPLKQASMSTLVADSVVFIGNAANTLHPVAGQGFNLGLRDVAMLAQCITQAGLNSDMLRSYERSRQQDQAFIKRFTNGLIQLFTHQSKGLGLARSIGLFTLDNIPLLKALLARYTRGFAGVIPDLVCGIPLSEQ